MAEQVKEEPVLTREEVRAEAWRILNRMGVDQERLPRADLEPGWRRLWQLLREAKASQFSFSDMAGGPWHWRDHDGGALPLHLAAGHFLLEVFPPGFSRLAAELPPMLNWAGVPIPPVQRNDGRDHGL